MQWFQIPYLTSSYGLMCCILFIYILYIYSMLSFIMNSCQVQKTIRRNWLQSIHLDNQNNDYLYLYFFHNLYCVLVLLITVWIVITCSSIQWWSTTISFLLITRQFAFTCLTQFLTSLEWFLCRFQFEPSFRTVCEDLHCYCLSTLNTLQGVAWAPPEPLHSPRERKTLHNQKHTSRNSPGNRPASFTDEEKSMCTGNRGTRTKTFFLSIKEVKNNNNNNNNKSNMEVR